MLSITKSLIAVYEAAKVNNDSEVLKAVDSAIELNVPIQLINKCLSLAHSSNVIENARLTIIAELRCYKFCSN